MMLFVEKLTGEAEHAAPRGELSVVYEITKQLSGKNTTQSAPVRDRVAKKDGKHLTTEHK